MNGIIINCNINLINKIKINTNSEINKILNSDKIGYYKLIDYINNEYYIIYIDNKDYNINSENYFNIFFKNIIKNINSSNGLCLIIKYNLLTHNIINIENNLFTIIEKFE